MCGRFVAFSSADAIADRLALQAIADGARLLPPNWNVAPTNQIRVIHNNTLNHNSTLDVARWGLLTPWAHKSSRGGGTGIINARIETVTEKPTFANAFTNRRCIVPVDGYYEWQKVPDGKQPWFITGPTDNLYFAGIYNQSEAGINVAILTMAAAPEVAAIHHRMPVSFPETAFEQWLTGTPDDALGLVNDADNHFHKWEVSRLVNSVRNNGAHLIDPIEVNPIESGPIKLENPPEKSVEAELTLF